MLSQQTIVLFASFTHSFLPLLPTVSFIFVHLRIFLGTYIHLTTPLHLAAENGHLSVCKLIIEMGLNNSMGSVNSTRIHSVTPYHLAAENGHLEICCLISQYRRSPCDYVSNPSDDDNLTPFHYAAENGHLSVCKFFVDNLSNKNPKDDVGRTPF